MPQKSNNNLLIYVLIVLGISAVFLSYFQLRGAIYAPFGRPAKPREIDKSEILYDLTFQDTDQDGLTDFDERFVYLTSIYIFDSDSDSFSDKEEVEAGSDPLDPKSTPYFQTNKKESLDQENFLEQIFPSPQELEDNRGITAEEIKDLLINQAGLSQNVVDKFDDKTLIKLYNETKEDTGIDLKNLPAPEESKGQFSDLDIKTLRQFLIDSGVEIETLEQVSDQDLESLFLQSLLQLQGSQ